MNRSTLLLAACLALLAASGCGQKGALYLPDPPHQAVPATPVADAPVPTPADADAARRKTPRVPDPAAAQ